MPYINDDSIIKCDFEALYHGDIIVEGGYADDETEEAASENSCWTRTSAPVLERRNLDGDLTGYVMEHRAPDGRIEDFIISASDDVHPLQEMIERGTESPTTPAVEDLLEQIIPRC